MSPDAAEVAPEPPDPLVGVLVSERYEVLRVLGSGGMGRVYEAEHVLIKRRVALKCLHAQYAARPDVVARFRREALAATAVHNRHIVEVTDMGRLPDGGVFLVLELLDGRDLARELARGGALSFARAVHVALQLCDGLGAAHAAGIVHRDLKPENVFLTVRDGDRDFVKIVDFGISKFKHGDETATDTGVILGTPMYMAPEQVQGQKTVDHRADLYAVGVILYRSLTGRSPFTAPTPLGVVYQVCTAAAPPLTEHRPDAPAALAAIVARLLEKAPERRFPDAAALAEALRAVPVAEGEAPPPSVEPVVSVSGVQRTALSVEAAPTLPAPAAPAAAPSAPVAALPAPPPAPAEAVRPRWARAAVAAAAAVALALVGWRALTPRGSPAVAAPAAPARAASPAHVAPMPAPAPSSFVDAPVTAAASALVPAAPAARAPPARAARREPARTPAAAVAPPPAAPPPAAPSLPATPVAPVARPQDGVYRGPRNGIPETL